MGFSRFFCFSERYTVGRCPPGSNDSGEMGTSCAQVALDEQARACEHHERQRHLADDQGWQNALQPSASDHSCEAWRCHLIVP